MLSMRCICGRPRCGYISSMADLHRHRSMASRMTWKRGFLESMKRMSTITRDGDCGSLSLRCRLRTGRYHWRMARLRYKCSLRHPSSFLWAEMLVDFGFAFAFGIIFQYFSIAPMANEYGPKIVYRALKADALSLLFFEIGLFGWMAIFQIA